MEHSKQYESDRKLLAYWLARKADAQTASDSVLDRVGVTKSDNQNTNIFLGDVQFINAVPRPERNAQD